MKHIFDLRGKFRDHLSKQQNFNPYTKLEYQRRLRALGIEENSDPDNFLAWRPGDCFPNTPAIGGSNDPDKLLGSEEEARFIEFLQWDMLKAVEDSQTILFRSEQAKVFLSLAQKDKIDLSFPYRLPYPNVLIQFDNLIVLDKPSPWAGYKVGGVFLTDDGFGDCAASLIFSDFDYARVLWELDDFFAYRPLDLNCEGDRDDLLAKFPDYKPLGDDRAWREKYIINFAAALVMFINSETVELVRETPDPLASNNKKDRYCKKRDIQPYYVCRIRGVKHATSDSPGTGSKQTIRYDVRGHFRRLAHDKVIWVRPHQRGLQNELYIPKVYKVDKQPAPDGERP